MAETVDMVMGPGGVADAPLRPPIQVVPRRGLVIVGAVVVFVIVSIAGNWFWALDLFVGLVVGPIMGRLSIEARAEFAARFMPKMVLIMPTVVLMTLAAGFQLALKVGSLEPTSPNHGWIIASFVVVGVMAVIALGLLEPANIAVLFEMKKPKPDGEVISRLMQRFIYTAGITGVLQIATLIIMTRVATQ
jgi:hypothetical protein